MEANQLMHFENTITGALCTRPMWEQEYLLLTSPVKQKEGISFSKNYKNSIGYHGFKGFDTGKEPNIPVFFFCYLLR